MLGYGTSQQTASPALGDLIVSYASILAAQVTSLCLCLCGCACACACVCVPVPVPVCL